MTETLTVRYYEAEDGSVILYDEQEHQGASRLIEPVILEGLDWRFEEGCSLPLPRARWEEKVYRLQEVKVLATESGRRLANQRPQILARHIQRLVHRSVMNQIGSSFA